jgi:hypothetical protein
MGQYQRKTPMEIISFPLLYGNASDLVFIPTHIANTRIPPERRPPIRRQLGVAAPGRLLIPLDAVTQLDVGVGVGVGVGLIESTRDRGGQKQAPTLTAD